MGLNKDLIKAFAEGNKEALETVNGLPINLRMAYAIAKDEYLKQNEVAKVDSEDKGFDIYEKKKSSQEDQDALGEAIANRLKILKENEAEQERIKQEHAEKKAKQQADRSRALGSYGK